MSIAGSILVVDDDAINVEIMQEILDDEFDVSVAQSGEEALERIQEAQPDLVLLDIMMPGMDGYETCRRMRATSEMRHGKIILVSAKAMLSERMTGYAAGADDYITKPFDGSELLAKARVFLRLKRVEEVEELQSSMLAVLRSETRTPMTGILSAAELLAQETDIADDERAGWNRMILDNAKRLDAFLDRGSLLCDYKAGTVRLSVEPVELANIVGRAARMRGAEIESKGLTLSLGTSNGAWVQGHAEHLRLVCDVLLDNAIKYSNEGGSVEIEINKDDRHVTLKVTDHGVGIIRAKQAYLFDGFVDAERGVPQKTGLSLALSRAVVQYHGGMISLKSTPGVETTFTVTLPYSGEDVVKARAESLLIEK